MERLQAYSEPAGVNGLYHQPLDDWPVSEAAPGVAAGAPPPQIALLPQALQAPKQVHAALVGHG